MKIAEGLILRADLQKRIEQIKDRLVRSAKVQEGEEPPEDPNLLLQELNELIEQHTLLVQRINKTNSSVVVSNGKTLTDLLAERDSIILKRRVLDSLIQATAIKHDRYSKSEVKFFSTVKVSKVQQEIDLLSKNYRELDAKIQEINWLTELHD
ncbi:MAG: DIP1984 family protein [Firmicutes bacterium]|nr:DIP1984 family protein [Bacillota bacterium]